MALAVVNEGELEAMVRKVLSGSVEAIGWSGMPESELEAREYLLRLWAGVLYEDKSEECEEELLGILVMPALGAVWLPSLDAQARFKANAPRHSFSTVTKFSRSSRAVTHTSSASWHLEMVQTAGTGLGVRVGIADSGFDPSAASVNLKAFAEFHQNSGKLTSTTPVDHAGTNLHGTQVASYACGATEGVAPDADVFVAAVLTQNGGKDGTPVQVAAGLNWLRDQGVQVLNCSFGTTKFDVAWYDLFANLRKAGVIVVAAMGNKNDPECPALFDTVVGIGAVNSKGQVASFSTSGPGLDQNGAKLKYLKPDDLYPGDDVYGEVRDKLLDGTSFASPIAAGVIACNLANYNKIVPLKSWDIVATLAVTQSPPEPTTETVAVTPQTSSMEKYMPTTFSSSEIDPTIAGFRLENGQGQLIGLHQRGSMFDTWAFVGGMAWPQHNFRGFVVQNTTPLPNLGSVIEIFVAPGKRFDTTATGGKPPFAKPAAPGNRRSYLIKQASNGLVLAFLSVDITEQTGVIESGHPFALTDNRLPVASGGAGGRVLPPDQDLVFVYKSGEAGAPFQPTWGKYLEVT
jgi:hypothetical protein